ncbi:MAG TPA: protein kinase, partial [Longimicrobium sp.]|nr:protein kinase [Longimicrobium sp.]
AREYQKRQPGFPVALACYITCRLCEGLDYAHRATDLNGTPLKLVHRDISPSNCIISVNGEVKLIDFGIAKAANGAVRTQNGVLKGKAAYLSPEMIRGQTYDRRSDLFALGVMLYELLTGHRPFEGKSDVETLMKIADCEVDPLRKHNPAIPEEVEEAVLKLLARKPDHRYQWASELQADLERYLVTTSTQVGAKDLSRFMTEVFGAQALMEDVGSFTPSPRVALRSPLPPEEPPPHPTLTATPAPMRLDSATSAATRISKEPERLARELISPPAVTAEMVPVATATEKTPAPSPVPASGPAPAPRARRRRALALLALGVVVLGLGGGGWWALRHPEALFARMDAEPSASASPPKQESVADVASVSGSPPAPTQEPVADPPPASAQEPVAAVAPAAEPPAAPAQEPVVAVAPATRQAPAIEAPPPFAPEPVAAVAPAPKPGSTVTASAPAPRKSDTTVASARVEPRKKPAPEPSRAALPAVTPETGVAYLTIQSNRPSKIFVDGVEVGETPKRLMELVPGAHTVRVDCIYDWGRHEGRTRSLTIPKDGEATLRHSCEEQAPTPATPPSR